MGPESPNKSEIIPTELARVQSPIGVGSTHKELIFAMAVCLALRVRLCAVPDASPTDGRRGKGGLPLPVF